MANPEFSNGTLYLGKYIDVDGDEFISIGIKSFDDGEIKGTILLMKSPNFFEMVDRVSLSVPQYLPFRTEF